MKEAPEETIRAAPSHPGADAPGSPRDKPLSLLHGRLCIVLAALLWSTSGAFTKLLTQPTGYGLDHPAAGERLDGLQIAFGRAFFAGLSLLTLLRRGDVSFRPAMIPVAICFTAMNALYVTAMAIGSAANAVFLQYTAPIWLAFAGVFWLKEPADGRTLLSLAVSMVGVAVIVAGSWNDQLLAAGLAVGSGVTYAGVLIGLRLLRGLSSRWLTVFNHLFAAAALSPALLFCWKATPSWPQVVTLALYGSLQMGLPYFLAARGLRVVSSQEAG
ncbi:MAG TPA: DMT family transporter, partial [Gemmataceae bacterium]|nr:DMT family transporter [Gemmataceae bacterium]